jgi:hypothetical protein
LLNQNRQTTKFCVYQKKYFTYLNLFIFHLCDSAKKEFRVINTAITRSSVATTGGFSFMQQNKYSEGVEDRI